MAAEQARDNANIMAKGIARRANEEPARNQETPRPAPWAREGGSLLQTALRRINLKIYGCCEKGIAIAGTGSD